MNQCVSIQLYLYGAFKIGHSHEAALQSRNLTRPSYCNKEYRFVVLLKKKTTQCSRETKELGNTLKCGSSKRSVHCQESIN